MSLFDLLAALLLAGHLWCAGAAIFAPCLAAICEIAEARGLRDLGVLGRAQSRMGIVLLVLSALIGLIYGALVWDSSLSHGLARLHSRVVFGTIEWFFSLILIVSALVWWHRRPQARRVERGLRIATVLLAATNLAYHFPVFFEVLTNLRGEDSLDASPVNSAEFRHWLVRPRVISQVVHFWLASLLAGASMIVIVMSTAADGWDRPLGNLMQRSIGAILVVSTSLQIMVGTWVTSNVSPGRQYDVTDPSDPLAWIFMMAVLLAIGLIPHGISLLFGTRRKRPPYHLVFHVGLVFFMMALLTRLLKVTP